MQYMNEHYINVLQTLLFGIAFGWIWHALNNVNIFWLNITVFITLIGAAFGIRPFIEWVYV